MVRHRAVTKPRKRARRTMPESYRHRPPMYGELSSYLRIRRLRDKRRAEQDGTMQKARVSEPLAHPDLIQAPPWRPIKNPDARFLGLPIEIRLEIYGHLSDTKLIHVHSPRANHYTWTPCKGTNPIYSHLCLNPKWSGLCSETDRCTSKRAAPPEPRGFWALRATTKMLRHEMADLVMSSGAYSIHPKDVRGWLRYLNDRRPRQMQAIRSIALAGPDHYILSPGYGVVALQDEMANLPNLSAIGIQCQTPRYWWLEDGKEEVELVPRWEQWDAVEAMQGFGPIMTCVVEGMIWIKKRSHFDEGKGKRVQVKERQAVIRIAREGKEDGYEGEGWENGDVRLEVEQPRALMQKRRDAEWRIWWKQEELKYFG